MPSEKFSGADETVYSDELERRMSVELTEEEQSLAEVEVGFVIFHFWIMNSLCSSELVKHWFASTFFMNI